MNNVTFKANNQHQYAHLVKENPLQKVASSVQTHASNINNLKTAIVKGQGSDYTLGRMNDSTIRVGSLGIATLASAKALSKVTGMGEFLGFATWFASMGLSPKIINKMVQVKYGLNLDQEYVDSYGRRKKVFDDPGFICWDLIPDQKLYSIGDRMGVPQNIVNRKEAIQEKITQVVVQSKTWMMVSVGVTTPVLASLLADSLKKPVNSLFSFIHQKGLNNLDTSIEKAVNAGNTDKAKQIMSKLVQRTFGETDASAISRLWKSAPEVLVKETGITTGALNKLGEVTKTAKKPLTGFTAWISEIAGQANRAFKAKKLSAVVDHLVSSPEEAKKGLVVIEENLKAVNGWKSALMKHSDLLDDAGKEFINLRAKNFEAALNGMKKALSLASEGKADKKLIEKFLKGINISQAERWSVEKIAEFTGKSTAEEIKNLLAQGKTEKTIKLLSKRPFNLIDDAVKDTLLHKRWLKRIGGIGLAVLAATAIYVFLCMGKSNKYNPKIESTGGNV